MSSEDLGAASAFLGFRPGFHPHSRGVGFATRCSMKFDSGRRCFLCSGLAGRARFRSRRELGLSRWLGCFLCPRWTFRSLLAYLSSLPNFDPCLRFVAALLKNALLCCRFSGGLSQIGSVKRSEVGVALPQHVEQHGQLARRRHDRLALGALAAAFGQP